MKARWLVVLIVAVLLAGEGVAAWMLSMHTFAGLVQDPPKPAPDISLTDDAGKRFALSDLRGRWIMLEYGYTTCPDVCPTTLAFLAEIRRRLGPDARQVSVVFVTIDPERDTGEVIGRYVKKFDPEFKGLTGTPAEIATAAQAYDVKYSRVESQSAAGYLMSHSAFVYVIDPQFRYRLQFPFGVPLEEMTADMKYLMSQEEN